MNIGLKRSLSPKKKTSKKKYRATLNKLGNTLNTMKSKKTKYSKLKKYKSLDSKDHYKINKKLGDRSN